jgi:hypothetical protein
MIVGKVGFQRFWLAQLQQAEKCGATAPLLLAFYLFDKSQKVKDVDVFLCSCDSWKQMWRTNIGIFRNYSLPIIILELTWGIDCSHCFSWQLFLLIGTTHLFLYVTAIAEVMILHTVVMEVVLNIIQRPNDTFHFTYCDILHWVPYTKPPQRGVS